MNDANQGHRRRLPGAGRRSEETPSDQSTTREGIRLPQRGEPQPAASDDPAPSGDSTTQAGVQLPQHDEAEPASDEEVTHTGIRLPRNRQQAPPADEETTHSGIQLPRHDEGPSPSRPEAGAGPASTQAFPAAERHDPASTQAFPAAERHDPASTQAFPAAGQQDPSSTEVFPVTYGSGPSSTARLSAADGTMPSPGLDEGSTSEAEPGDRKRSGAASLLREMAIVVSVALVISFLVKTFLAQPFWIPSGSMNDTLIRGDRVIVSKLTPSPVDLDRGDVVVFEDPGGWLPPVPQDRGPVLKALEFVGLYPAGDNHLIKRVIGMPGDKVVCCDDKKRITVNGTPLTEPYLHQGDEPSSRKFSITVPADKVWVMGDHRSDSSDSRFHDDGTGKTGSVPIDNITGRALVTVWPLDRMGWLSDHSSTFEKVSAP